MGQMLTVLVFIRYDIRQMYQWDSFVSIISMHRLNKTFNDVVILYLCSKSLGISNFVKLLRHCGFSVIAIM